MKKFHFVIMLFVFLGLSESNAQVKLVLNGGVQQPSKDSFLFLNTGYGFSTISEFTITKSSTSSIALTASAGYNRWKFSKDFLSFTSPFSGFNVYTVPIMGGVKFFFKSFYFGNSLGASVTGTNVPVSNTPTTTVTVNKNTSTDFIWTPYIGLRLNNIDFNIKYQNIRNNGNTFSWFGFNAGYAFGG